MKNTSLAYRELPGEVGKCFFSDGKVGPRGFGKNHPHCVAVFFPKTLPYRKHLPSGPCSSTGCQSPNIHNLKIKSHEPSICNKRTDGSHGDARAGNKKKEKSGNTRTPNQIPAERDDRAGTHFHLIESHPGNMPPPRQEQVIVKII